MPKLEQQQLVDCVRRARNGDQLAWEKLDDCLRSSILAKLRFPRHVDPEEVASDAIADVWRVLKTLRNEQKIVNFTLRVARRVASKKHDDSKKFAPLPDDPPTELSEDDDLAAANAERGELLEKMTRPLREADKKLFRLLYVVGASHQKVEEETGLTGTRLRQHKHRMHKRLRESQELRRELELL